MGGPPAQMEERHSQVFPWSRLMNSSSSVVSKLRGMEFPVSSSVPAGRSATSRSSSSSMGWKRMPWPFLVSSTWL